MGITIVECLSIRSVLTSAPRLSATVKLGSLQCLSIRSVLTSAPPNEGPHPGLACTCLSIRSVLTSAPLATAILARIQACLSIRSVLTSAPWYCCLDFCFRQNVSVDQVSADVGAGRRMV